MPVSKLRALANLISDTVAAIEQYCALKDVVVPDLDAPFSLQSEGPLMDPEIAGLATNVVAAAAQLSAILKPAPMGALLTALQVRIYNIFSQFHTHNYPFLVSHLIGTQSRARDKCGRNLTGSRIQSTTSKSQH